MTAIENLLKVSFASEEKRKNKQAVKYENDVVRSQAAAADKTECANLASASILSN